MDDHSAPACPQCLGELAIRSAGEVPVDAATDPEVFMTLPYRVSSSARWVCDEHGDVGRVIVSVVDDRVEFVPIPPHS